MGKLDTSLKILDNGILDYSPAQAMRNIRAWEDELNKSSNATLQKIGKDLGELRDALQGGPDGARIAEVLTRLADSTTQVAGEAEGTTAQGLKKLGTVLNKAGQQLTKGAAKKVKAKA